tara:strand:+ start:385 stop:570 length:186 start_codon:yes stop_codon:yes gene_type:complete
MFQFFLFSNVHLKKRAVYNTALINLIYAGLSKPPTFSDLATVKMPVAANSRRMCNSLIMGR